jgi:hypothetical protein
MDTNFLVHIARLDKLSLLHSRIRASMEQSQQGDDFGIATLRLRGLDLKNVEPGLLGLGRSDPFFEVARKNADHAAGLVRW